MPKRSAQQKLEKYKRKIRKLEGKEMDKKKYWRRIRQRLDSSDDENIAGTNEAELCESQNGSFVDSYEDQIQFVIDPDLLNKSNFGENAVVSTVEQIPEVNLDPELLSALGSSTFNTPDFGEDIHESLVSLWTPLLQKGLPKKEKDSLMKEHLVPANCKLLQAPKLNAEIAAAVSDIVKGRDKKLLCFQQQLGQGTAAINKAMDLLLKSDNKVLALKHLSDGCRLLTDLHHCLTQDRVKLTIPSLEKNFLQVIQDLEWDDTLYDNSLSEKIKASKAIERQGSLIKKSIANPKYSSPQRSITQHVSQGNFLGPPRYPSNRGGARRSEETIGDVTPAICIAVTSASEELLRTEEPCITTQINKVHAGRIQSFLSCWYHITNNTVVLSWIENGLTIPFCTRVTQPIAPFSTFTYDESRDMQIAINKLLELGAISRCIPTKDQYISKVF